MRALAGIAAILVLGTGAQALVFSTGASADEIAVQDFAWDRGNINAYCFFKPTKPLSNAKGGGERYVFISETPEFDPEAFDKLPLDPAKIPVDHIGPFRIGFMSINHRFRELGIKSSSYRAGDVTIVYATYGKKPYRIVLKAKEGKAGNEWQDFSGTITVKRGGDSKSLHFKGQCGA